METQIINWILTISKSEQIPEGIKAVNIGLVETENGYTLYMVGSNEYDAEDSDWACNEDFVPENKYLVVEGDSFNKMPWDQFLKDVVEILKNFVKSEEYKNSILYSVPHVTTGFDGGDLEIIK